jgi:hypothetical protein
MSGEKETPYPTGEETDMTATTEYFQISDERATEIAACHDTLTPDIVREYATADWAEGDEHQLWINTAPAQEIADWIISQR